MSKSSAALKAPEGDAAPQPQQSGLTNEDTHNDTKRRIAEVMLAVKGLHGSEKAAILLLSLGEDAKPVWDRLDDEDATLRFLFGTRSMFGDGTTLTAEWLYQSDGLLQKEWDDLATLQTRVGDEARAGRLDPSTLAVE